jgi:hypothetical protein
MADDTVTRPGERQAAEMFSRVSKGSTRTQALGKAVVDSGKLQWNPLE